MQNNKCLVESWRFIIVIFFHHIRCYFIFIFHINFICFLFIYSDAISLAFKYLTFFIDLFTPLYISYFYIIFSMHFIFPILHFVAICKSFCIFCKLIKRILFFIQNAIIVFYLCSYLLYHFLF